MPLSRVTNPDLQFIISIAVAILFGILGVAGMISFGWAVTLLAGAMLFAGWSLWRSHWLSALNVFMRSLVVLGFVGIYSALAYPALNRLAHKPQDDRQKQVIQNANDCSSNINGDNDKSDVNCSDKSKK